MDFELLALPAVFVVGASSVALLLSRTWRWRVGALAVQYVGVFVLVSLSWPVDLSAVKLVSGWMAGAILGISRLDRMDREVRRWPTERLYFIFLALLVVLTVATSAPGLLEWIPNIHLYQAWGGLVLLGMGLVHLGLAARGMRVILSLLMLLSGFEILYAVVEYSTLVAGLLAVVTVGIAMAGAYLMSAQDAEDDE